MKILISLLLSFIAISSAQPAKQTADGHSIPFASSGNRIELSIANTSTVALNSAEIVAENVPSWIKFTTTKEMITQLSSNESKIAAFTFSVDKSAPINKPHTLKFTISSPTGEKWTKEIAIQISAPEKFELFQNYPNPFNPSTTIEYTMPISGNVVLKIYDAIGREVVTLFDGVKDAGFHQQVWNASTVATGMYIYQLAYKNQKGELEFYRKKMLMTK